MKIGDYIRTEGTKYRPSFIAKKTDDDDNLELAIDIAVDSMYKLQQLDEKAEKLRKYLEE